jgi:cyanophycin synthetase
MPLELQPAATDSQTPVATGRLRVLEKAVYRGPNLHSRGPLIRIQVDLGALEDWPTNRLPGFTDRLLELLPSLEGHGCCFHEAGGFIRRLREGTWLGHVAEHIALELQTLAGSPVSRGKTRSVRGRPGVYDIMYVYNAEAVGLLAGRRALELVNSLLPEALRGVRGLDMLHREDPRPAGATFELEPALAELTRVARRTGFGPTTASLVKEARRRGIPVQRLDEFSLVQLGWGRRQEFLRASITGRTSHIAVENAGNKNLTRSLLLDAGLPAPRGVSVRDAEDAVREADRLGYPVVTKPLDGNHGRGVSIGLKTPDEVRWGFDQAIREGRRVIVEQFFEGKDHRILVVGGQVVAVAERVPAHVVGDGASTISQLIDEVNTDPRRGVGHEQVMTRIKVDDHVREVLARDGLDVGSVPAAGQTVFLRATANLSTGGTAVDRTDVIHPENVSIARRAALAVGLDVAGIDFLAPDITRSVRETGGGIVEVNAAPGFRMHLEPSEGQARNVAKPVIRMLFPTGAGRVPVTAVTGTNGKSTTCRMVAMILREAGLNVGLTNTSGVYVNDERISTGDATGPKSARRVLSDPTVDAAVLETARGGLLREGLAFDRCDVGAVLNVQADHLGLKGIENLADLGRVKGVIVENVRRDGTSVLNADDPYTARMTKRARGRIAWFSMQGAEDMPGFLRRHLEDGGLAAVRSPDGRDLVIWDAGQAHTLMPAAQIPATMSGMAEFNVANALAAALIAYAQGIGIEVIRAALAKFTSSFEQSPGRLNIHDAHGFRVILDYAHNPAGLTALTEMIERMRKDHARVIGMISIPGDRRNEDILEMGHIAAHAFDDLVFRERPDGRGRPSGEVMALLSKGALEAGFPPDRMQRVIGEAEAAEAAMAMARPGDLVVLTPTDIESVWASVLAFQPQAMQRGDQLAVLGGEPPHG